jgi:thiol:disulfide interchange protein
MNNCELTLFGQQAKLGIYGLLRGYVCEEWVQAQQQYLYRNRKEVVHQPKASREALEANVREQYDFHDQYSASDQRFIYRHDLDDNVDTNGK